MTPTLAQPAPSAVVEAASASMSRELERADRLATVLRWRRYMPLAHFSAADRALLASHRKLLRSLHRLELDAQASQRRLEREVMRSLRAYERERRAGVRAARHQEYAAWEPERALACPACR